MNQDTIHQNDKQQTESTQQSPALTMEYLLSQIEKVAAQTDHLHEAIQALSDMDDGENAEGMSVGNTLGPAKAAAIGEVVRCRETTNQQMLRLYEKMYDDLKPAPVSEDILKLQQLAQTVEHMPAEVAATILQKASQQMFVHAGCPTV